MPQSFSNCCKIELMGYVLVFLSLFLTPAAWAYDFSPQSTPQKSKIATRWSLAQWMEQKGRLSWMDLWLNSNSTSPSFYEMYLGGDYAEYKSTKLDSSNVESVTKDLRAWRAHGGAFISLLGVYGQYEKSPTENREQIDALGLLRILGQSDQGSNLVGFYGLHQQNFQNDSVKQSQAGGYLTLYILDFFAVQGKYQQFFKNTSDQGLECEGHRLEATSWVEWGAVRLYGTYYKEPLKYTDAAAGVSNVTREGFYMGLRVYLDFKK